MKLAMVASSDLTPQGIEVTADDTRAVQSSDFATLMTQRFQTALDKIGSTKFYRGVRAAADTVGVTVRVTGGQVDTRPTTRMESPTNADPLPGADGPVMAWFKARWPQLLGGVAVVGVGYAVYKAVD